MRHYAASPTNYSAASLGCLIRRRAKRVEIAVSLKIILLIAVLIVAVAAGAIVFGSSRWKIGTNELRTKLEAARLRIMPTTYDAREIESLPPPVRRYFRAVLKHGQPIVSAARLAHDGQFNMDETEAKWSRFTSSQLVITRRPGFDWDGRIKLAPGMTCSSMTLMLPARVGASLLSTLPA